MARVQYGGIVTSLSGSVGGSTFQKSQFGSVLRNKPIPRKSGTSRQLNNRQLMMQLHQYWRALDPGVRLMWDQFVTYSQTKINRDHSVLTSGHALFIQYNFLRLLTQQEILGSPSYSPLFPWPVIQYMYVDLGTFFIQFMTNPPGVNNWFVLQLTSPRPPQVKFSNRGLEFIFCPFADDYLQMITDSYLAVFGALPVNGDTLHYRIRHYSLASPIISPVYTGTWVLTNPPD